MKNVMLELKGRPVLRQVDLVFSPGSLTVIQGRSGAGLSVLLKTAAGLLLPTSGQVLYDGQAYAAMNEKQRQQLQTRTGFVFQDAALWANMSLGANLHLPLQVKHPASSFAERQEKIEEVLQQHGFSVDLNLRPVDLSQGQQKFLAFLRAVIPQPEALFLDDPLAGMDPRWTKTVIRALEQLRSRGVALVLGNHNSLVPRELCDRVVHLEQGRINDD